jgi:hypothetical protein
MKRYDKKISSIIRESVGQEEIIFQGRRITREFKVKEFILPKIITEDIGFQLQFGMKPNPITFKSQESGIEVHTINKQN